MPYKPLIEWRLSRVSADTWKGNTSRYAFSIRASLNADSTDLGVTDYKEQKSFGLHLPGDACDFLKEKIDAELHRGTELNKAEMDRWIIDYRIFKENAVRSPLSFDIAFDEVFGAVFQKDFGPWKRGEEVKRLFIDYNHCIMFDIAKDGKSVRTGCSFRLECVGPLTAAEVLYAMQDVLAVQEKDAEKRAETP